MKEFAALYECLTRLKLAIQAEQVMVYFEAGAMPYSLDLVVKVGMPGGTLTRNYCLALEQFGLVYEQELPRVRAYLVAEVNVALRTYRAEQKKGA